MAGQGLGTPAYMAPEQARDATKVDHRADVYSLGCTLYVLVTGRPVYPATTALEVMTRHASDPVPRADVVVKGVPKALSDVVVKMLAKKPEERYPSMDEVIKALEDFLGLQGQQAQTEQHVRTLEQGAKGFLEAPATQLRSWILLAFFGGCSALFLFLVVLGAWRLAGAILGLEVLTALAYLVVHGAAHRTHLFLKFRDLALSAGWLALGKAALGVLLFLGVLWLFGLFWVWLLAGLLGAGLAVGMHYALDRRIARQRAEALEKVEAMLRTLRLRGLSEEALHEFVCKHAGEHWEEFFEALFGYEAKLEARLRYGVGPKGARPRHAAWRDPVVRWIDRWQRRRQEERDRRRLQAVEQKSLEAQGVAAALARQKAEAVAGAMVQKAAELKQEAGDRTVAPEQGAEVTVPARKAPPPRRVNVQDLFQVAVEPPKPSARPGRVVGEFLGAVFGSSVRFVAGALLLLGCLFWLHKNGLLPSSTNFDDTATYRSIWEKLGEAEPLALPLPEAVLRVFGNINPGVAGLLLLVSSIWRSWKIGLLTLAGAAIMVLGPAYGVPWLVCLAVGGAVMLAGFLFGRDT
jgi:hypothetical protein